MTCVPLAMHMANELLSVPVALATGLLAGLAVVWAGGRCRKSIDAERLPLMGVMGAFVFAAQMINLPLPGLPGVSGHLGGAVLLAILLSPTAAVVTMTAILVVQSLVFQDGGLLALGCNIINMGLVPAFVGWGVYRLVLGPVQRARPWRQYVAAWAACVVGVTAGATLVPLQAAMSGVLRIPTVHFLAAMTGVHLIVGCIEGAITFAVVAYLRAARSQTLGLDVADAPQRLSRRAVVATLLATALLLAGVVSWFASASPDGLEWCHQERRYGDEDAVVENDSPTVAGVDSWQARWSPMSDYARRDAALGQTPAPDAEPTGEERLAAGAWPAPDGWTSLAGVVGTVMTLGVVYVVATVTRRRRSAA